MENSRDNDLLSSARYGVCVLWSGIAIPNWVQGDLAGTKMNTPPHDYSFVLGVVSAFLGLFVMLTAWLAVKALWKMHHSAHLGRPRRKQ